MSSESLELGFDRGVLVVKGPLAAELQQSAGLTWDVRLERWSCPANQYRQVVTSLHESKVPYTDLARSYERMELELKEPIVPRPHQQSALERWRQAQLRGTVCLPTGAGKTILAVMAMAHAQRPTLVVVPTIDLLHQWVDVLTTYFPGPVGALGGGSHECAPITVATYDSAAMHMERYGRQFGLLICDEVHHLPAPHYQLVALASIAPFRLGLTATLERSDAGEAFVLEHIGPLIYESQVSELVDTVLAPYDVETIQVDLSEEEQREYRTARELYRSFLRRYQVSFDRPGGWQDFLLKSARFPGGRAAFAAYLQQKQIAMAAAGKFTAIWKILKQHTGERTIIFTHDNEMAYQIGERFIAPVLTHHTKLSERRAMLAAFRSGEFTVLVTSRVLNEGVDVPEASIAIVVSGSGAVREHVQRLGRILRNVPGKRARLFELVAKDTGEVSTNQRRKQHHAYQGLT